MERRTSPRVPLDAPLFIQFVFSSGASVSAMLLDVSCGGLQAAVAPQCADTGDFLGQEVVVHGLPVLLDPVHSGCKGLVTWVSPQRCGVRLFNPLEVTEQELQGLNQSI